MYLIKMKNKNVFLDLFTGKPTWTTKKENACMWNEEIEAIIFADNWFKKFKEWEVVREY